MEHRRHVPVERGPPDEDLVEHHGQRVDVGAPVDRRALELLGRHVGQRAQRGARLGERAPARRALAEPHDAEVDEVHEVPSVRRGHQDVARLDVAVDEVVRVGVVEGVRELLDEADGAHRVERALLAQQPGEVASLDEAHVEVEASVDDAEVVDRDHVRRGQAGRRAALALEPLADLRVVREIRGQPFEGDLAVAPRVVRPVHLAHAATPETAGQTVGTEHLGRPVDGARRPGARSRRARHVDLPPGRRRVVDRGPDGRIRRRSPRRRSRTAIGSRRGRGVVGVVRLGRVKRGPRPGRERRRASVPPCRRASGRPGARAPRRAR